MYVVAVGDIVLVCHARNDAETLLQAFGKFVSGGFQRSSVQTEINVALLSPFGAGVVHMLHHLECKFLAFRVCVAHAHHVAGTFAESCVTQGDGGVTAVEQLINLLTLFQTGQRAVLPENRSHIRRCSLQTVVTAHERLVAEFQTLVEDLPELLHVFSGGAGHVHQIQGDNALIESAVELRLVVLVFIYCQEGTASHTRVAVALF